MSRKIKNIGILAHVDAGKTTITENMLFMAGAIRQQGSVDQGSSVSDFLEVEKERGISVKSASLSFDWKDQTINLIDTPGHADFSAEVERVLSALDGVILVISAVEGIQAHTITLWDAVKTLNLPCLIFINKIDRPGSDYIPILEELKNKMKIPAVAVYGAINEGEANAEIFSVFHERDTHPEIFEQSLEFLAVHDEDLLEHYFEGKHVQSKDLEELTSKLASHSTVVPVFTGMAKSGLGIIQLMEGMYKYLPNAQASIDTDPTGLIFKIEHDPNFGRLAYVRLYSGIIRNRDEIKNATGDIIGKVARLKKRLTSKLVDIEILEAGDIGVIGGLQDVVAGTTFGNPEFIPGKLSIQQAVLAVQVEPENGAEYAALAEALSVLNIEDPLLDFKWLRKEQEFHLSLMGNMQIEILKSILNDRFGIATKFKEPEVIYKETPAAEGIGYVEYTMPKPCWAVMRFKVEPGEKGSGIVYHSEVGVNNIQRKYQNEISATIPKAIKQGIKGWEVTDIKVTLIAGEDHEIHSRPGDFILATPMGIMRALQKAGTIFLEPYYKFEIIAPEPFLGDIASDVTKMRGTFESPVFLGDEFILSGKVPVSTASKYNIRLNSLSGGKAKLKLRFGGYEKCDDEHAKVKPYLGVNPLDESQWILHRRGAYKADERLF
jgi:ribosomal protection tetracycline resistance protein